MDTLGPSSLRRQTRGCVRAFCCAQVKLLSLVLPLRDGAHVVPPLGAPAAHSGGCLLKTVLLRRARLESCALQVSHSSARDGEGKCACSCGDSSDWTRSLRVREFTIYPEGQHVYHVLTRPKRVPVRPNAPKRALTRPSAVVSRCRSEGHDMGAVTKGGNQ